MTTVRNAIAGAIALALTAACGTAGGAPTSGPVPARDVVTLEVTNNNWADMNVYAVRSGMRHRLGTVTSMRTANFRLPDVITGAGSEVALLLDPIGARRTYSTGPIQVLPGQRVEFTIQNHLPLSSYAVWSR